MDKISLDWLSFTFRTTLDTHIGYAFSLIRELTGDDTIDWLQYSRLRGYSSCGSVLDGLGLVGVDYSSDRSLEMGVHLSLSASALGVLASRFGSVDSLGEVHFDFLAFVKKIISLSPPEHYNDMSDGKPYTNISRADFALDDFSGVINLPYIEHLSTLKFSGEAPGVFTTRFRNPAESHKSLGGRGATIYFGSPLSEFRLRFYDKSAERKLDKDFVWNRLEAQLRGDRADMFCRSLSSIDDISKLILGYLDFKDLSADSSDTNSTRFKTATWWSDFLGVTEKIRVSAGAVVKTVEDMAKWADKQLGTTLAILEDTLGSHTLAKIVSDGRAKFRKKHFNIIRAYNEVNNSGLSDLLLEAMSLGGTIVTSDETKDFMRSLNEEKRQKQSLAFFASLSDRWSVRYIKDKLSKEQVHINQLLGFDDIPTERITGAAWNLAGIDFVVDVG